MVLESYASHPYWKFAGILFFAAVLAGCGSMPNATPEEVPAKRASAVRAVPIDNPVLPPAGSGRGGYYLDDGPADQTPEGLSATPDPVPKVEPLARAANRPYVALGQAYTPLTDNRPYKKRGYGSWYGKKFHGKKTSSGERYDMFKMTAAHPTLPIPSYARVTNLNNGRQVIVRVNDRGPFHSSRIIDLSYTAALKLGYLGKGSGQLEVERLLPEEIERMAKNRREPVNTEPVFLAAKTEEKEPTSSTRDAMDELLATKKSQPGPAVKGLSAKEGYYVQLGAYKQAENAQLMRTQYELKWAGKMPTMEVAKGGAYYRLYAGPFASRDKAAEAAQQIQGAGGSKPLIVQR